MKKIEDLWTDINLEISNEFRHSGNEAELYPVFLSYKNATDGILKKDLLLRECIFWDKELHNAELMFIYDKLIKINKQFEDSKILYKLNFVEHFTDLTWNIYIKNINSKSTFNVYDLMPDSYYIDPEKKEKSKFKDFKDVVKELNLNRLFIINKLFEQLAILHANNFVVWEIKLDDRTVKHPTLSLFLYRLKNKKWNLDEEIFIHDIHNLKELESPNFSLYIKHCVSDIKNMSFDIIRFFKWIGLPQWWYKIYGKVLKDLNPELYEIMYRAFLRDPRIEIEIWAIEKVDSENKKERKTSNSVIKELDSFKKDKKALIKSIFAKDDVFFFSKLRDKISDFFDDINSQNTEIIMDFDNTLTYPGSSNSLNIAYDENAKLVNNFEIIPQDFFFRIWAISFLKLLVKKWYKIKIYSLWLKDVIHTLLEQNWLKSENIEIFANNINSIKKDKKELNLVLDETKKKLVIWDTLRDFDIEWLTKKDLKVWFLNEDIRNINMDKKLAFNWLLDFYFMNKNSNFIMLYELFKKLD